MTKFTLRIKEQATRLTPFFDHDDDDDDMLYGCTSVLTFTFL